MVRYYFNAKTTVEQALQLSIFKLREFGLLIGYCSSTLNWTWSCSGTKSSIVIVVDITGKPYAKLNYTVTDRNTGEKTKYDYKVQLTTTPCNYGGVRYWFICPLSRKGVYCGKRVAKLYKAPGTHYFACRHCYNLSYESRNEPRLARPGGIGYPIVAERLYEELYHILMTKYQRLFPDHYQISTKDYVRIYKQIMQNKPNLPHFSKFISESCLPGLQQRTYLPPLRVPTFLPMI